jgi:XisI protein/XisH protein
MAARDLFHNAVRNALLKEEWKITADPLTIKIDGVKFEIDLAAEKVLAAEKGHRMEKVAQYRQYIRHFLATQADSEENQGMVECQLVFDTEHDHYQLLDVGWEGLKQIYHCYIHLDIKKGKVWIQRNMTEIDVAAALVEMGIAKEDIVLGLHPPYKRPYTGYGVA